MEKETGKNFEALGYFIGLLIFQNILILLEMENYIGVVVSATLFFIGLFLGAKNK